jgi:restriction system protein
MIGQKFGHLTAVSRVGKCFKFRCDCGFEKVLRPTDVCRGHITTCGRSECEYHIATGVNKERRKSVEEGFAFEERFANVFKSAGYEIIKTHNTGDYGVDVIVWINGEKWAFQCKKSKSPAGVRAVAEVYAGGRFYDCTRFCVASPSGFTYQAKQMAAKLGVQLETSVFHFNVSLDQNAAELLKTQLTRYEMTNKLMWEIDGVAKTADEWCSEYNISRTGVMARVKKGMTLKDALITPSYRVGNTIEINGVFKTKKEWCDEYGISPQLYDYRVKYSGLSPLEALSKKKQNGGE